MPMAIELSNFHDPRGGFWSVPKIGRTYDVLTAYGRKQLVEMFLFTANLIMSLIFVALYAKSKQDRHILWLAIFTFLIGFRILLSGNKVISFFYPFLNWNQSIRLLYLIGFLLCRFSFGCCKPCTTATLSKSSILQLSCCLWFPPA
jgi:hypothetical protein